MKSLAKTEKNVTCVLISCTFRPTPVLLFVLADYNAWQFQVDFYSLAMHRKTEDLHSRLLGYGIFY